MITAAEIHVKHMTEKAKAEMHQKQPSDKSAVSGVLLV